MKLDSIHILTDENISPKVVKCLRDQGLDVLDAKEERWYGKEDQEILDMALEGHRFVLTHDSDFGTMSEFRGHHTEFTAQVNTIPMLPPEFARNSDDMNSVWCPRNSLACSDLGAD